MKDKIEKAKQKVAEKHEYGNWGHMMDEIFDSDRVLAFNEVLSLLEQEEEFISVETRLPDHTSYYLVSFDTGFMSDQFPIMPCHWDMAVWGFGKCKYPVKHWMELPEPKP